jgi:hypothetical protein
MRTCKIPVKKIYDFENIFIFAKYNELLKAAIRKEMQCINSYLYLLAIIIYLCKAKNMHSIQKKNPCSV